MKPVANVFLFVSAIVTVGFLASGFPLVGQDAYFHLNNLAQYNLLFSEGVLIPHWIPGAFNGFGSALFYFYPPLCSLLGSLIHWTGASLPWSMRILMLGCTAASVLSCHWYISLLPESNGSRWWAALLYAIAPYPFLDVIIRSAYGEYLAMPWIPILLGSIELARRSEGWSSKAFLTSVLACAAALSFILLSSIPMFAVLILVVPVYAVLRLHGRPVKSLIPLAAGIFLAILCTSYYWLPVLAFRNFVHLDHVLDDSVFRTSVLVNLAKSNPGTRTMVELYLLPLTVGVVIFWFARWRRERSLLDLAWAAVLCLVIVMHIPLFSGPLADGLPLMSIIQYPFRFYIMVSLAVAVWAAVATNDRDRRTAFGFAIVSGIGILAMSGLFYRIFGEMKQPALESRMSKNTFEYAPAETPSNGLQVVEYCRVHENDSEVQWIRNAVRSDTCYLIHSEGNASYYYVVLGDSMRVRFHRFYWPQWRLTTSFGRKLTTSWDSNGLLVTLLPAGSYILKMDLKKSPEEVIGARLSLGGMAIILLLLIPWNPQKRRGRQNFQP